MALTKTFTAATWASGSSTTSGTSNAVDISASYASEVDVQIVQVGTASTVASFTVEFSADAGSNFRSSVGPFNAGTAAATYKFGPIVCPPGQSSVRVVQTAQSGGTSSTITVDVSRTTAL
jgi:hypothetical protein